MTGRWTTPADIRARVRRRWDDGSLLRSYAAGGPFPTIEVPLRGPRVSEIAEDLGAVQRWVASFEGGSYALVRRPVGGRAIGRNELPARALVTSYPQAWSLLGVSRSVAEYDEILALTSDEPRVRDWVAAQPLKALALGAEWPRLLAAYRWLDAHRDSGRYVREIAAPGVDTKFVERHRTTLGALLGVPSTAPGFAAGLGLASKPELVRLRGHAEVLGLSGLTELWARVAELGALDLAVDEAVIVENEVTFLSLPPPRRGVVVWGKGFEVDRAGSLPWLREAAVHYWGDLDSHGFAILDQLRAWLPQTDSFLMDRATLLAHRERWVTEGSPTRARLSRLTEAEAALYDDLVTDRHGDRVRLEQERIDWDWVTQHLPYS